MRKNVFRRAFALLLCALLLAPWQVFAADTPAVVNADGVKLRTGPGTNYAAMTVGSSTVTLNRSAPVTIIGAAVAGEDGNSLSWYPVICAYNGNSYFGYIRSDLLTLSGGGGGTPESGTARLSLSGTGEAEVGNSVCVTLSVNSGTAIGAWRIKLSYDPAVLTYVSGADSARNGQLSFVNWSSGTTAVTFNLVFTAAKAGNTTLTVTDPQVVAYDDMTEMTVNDASFPVSVKVLHEHVWGSPVYTWSSDFGSCVATRTCVTDASHVEREEVICDSVQVTPATCLTTGKTTYTVTFLNEDFVTQSKTVVTAPALGHDWGEVSYTWTEDLSACTAARRCSRCNARETEAVDAEQTRIGNLVQYTASFQNAAFQEQVREKVAFIWGDADGNGTVNNRDIVRLKNYLANYDEDAGASTAEIFPGADADGNGTVNNRDVVRLKNYLANLDETTGLSTVTLGSVT